MIAVDTNVLVRFLVDADDEQFASARQLFARNSVAISTTVFLETEWVLRRSFGFGRDRIGRVFRDLLGIELVVCRDAEAVLYAVEALEQGCDFADALHAATADPDASAFVTFDREFAKRAPRIPGLPPIRLLRSGRRNATP
jgi:predicted nucleic-acid-binding protein